LRGRMESVEGSAPSASVSMKLLIVPCIGCDATLLAGDAEGARDRYLRLREIQKTKQQQKKKKPMVLRGQSFFWFAFHVNGVYQHARLLRDAFTRRRWSLRRRAGSRAPACYGAPATRGQRKNASATSRKIPSFRHFFSAFFSTSFPSLILHSSPVASFAAHKHTRHTLRTLLLASPAPT
jgi:hypothetical protein